MMSSIFVQVIEISDSPRQTPTCGSADRERRGLQTVAHRGRHTGPRRPRGLLRMGHRLNGKFPPATCACGRKTTGTAAEHSCAIGGNVEVVCHDPE